MRRSVIGAAAIYFDTYRTRRQGDHSFLLFRLIN